ncbi:50S ribosomal protein L37ae [Candidatus Woesearchaeota archaeon]|nr:MAG: 50S ribosomal protein L37ae [Candidatus Woesearchaeota archaeon]
MAKKSTLSTKKFGPRYGRTTKAKYAKIDSMQKASYKCPYCNHVKVKRENLGIWQCGTCNSKFTSKAYMVPKTKEKTE